MARVGILRSIVLLKADRGFVLALCAEYALEAGNGLVLALCAGSVLELS